MKNIHLIPTDKPSRLIHNDANQLCYQSNKSFKNDRKLRKKFNIYITSDEEIKEGDWCLLNNRLVVRYFKPPVESKSFKKIILTTDQDLIKDGVQEIDDEFLEWFVKNPNCESVEIEKQLGCVELDAVCDFGGISCPNAPNCLKNKYKIIIPKEEPKQEITLEEVFNEEKVKGVRELVDKHKQETLEEAAVFKSHHSEEDFIRGGRWQQERMYSEEEVFNLLMELSSRDRNSSSGTPHSIAKWFEQFKK